MDENRIITTLLELKHEVAQCIKRPEFDAFRHEVTRTNEEMVTILRRLDQERVFTLEWIRRVEDDVRRIKGHLKMA